MAAIITAEFGPDCDLYKALGVERSASDKAITRAYRKLALKYHPDKQKGDEASRAKATATFQAVSAIHSILSNKDTRAAYDESGTIQFDDYDETSPSFQIWTQYFARVFPKVSEEEIRRFEGEYRYSDEERRDVLAAYVKYKGEMPHILDTIMLSTDDDEARFVEMIEKAVENKEVETFPVWREYVKKQSMEKKEKKTNKPSAAQKRKQTKREKEAREAEALYRKIRGNEQKQDPDTNSIVLPSKRGMDSLLESLTAKYAKKGKDATKKAATKGPGEPSEDEFHAAQKRLKGRRNE
uniref:J domain-containing protein n=1 Tax=Peronospora matthiolae TaxID=2874970 RepID=A0AAV1UEQ4_9STRA